MNEISGFLTYSLRDPKIAAHMAKPAIRLNPACSSDLWSTLGDALFDETFRFGDGRTVFVGPVTTGDSFIGPCYCSLVVAATERAEIQLEGEMLPDHEHPRGLRA